MQSKENMIPQSDLSHRFVRKTHLATDEYRKNFQQIDREIIATITSVEADRVTPLMSKIYLQLLNAPAVYWEREGVLRFEAQLREEGKSLKAWAALCDLLGVASATANKALSWMHEVGIIGYFAGKNGVGIRIFLNRAASSIGTRKEKKILVFPPASHHEHRTSRNEAPSNASYAILELSDSDSNSCALQNSAKKTDIGNDESTTGKRNGTSVNHQKESEIQVAKSTARGSLSISEIVDLLKTDLESSLEQTARRAARKEHERTREWLENHGLPKAARVAQREAYNVLRKYGLISQKASNLSSQGEIGRSDYSPAKPRQLSDNEITDLAGACVAMLETKGYSINLTISEMSTTAGGFLLPEDAERVRDQANSLVSACSGGEGK